MVEDSLFSPRSVAVVGASTDPQKRGNAFIRFLQRSGFRGQLHPVNPKYREVLGLRCYPSLERIPTPVDLVICCLPAHSIPSLTHECVQKGVRLLHIYTAGFSETGLPERIELERQVIEIARRGHVRVLGPNCMGVYRPGVGLSFNTHSPTESGSVSVISHSGGNASDLGRMASVRGLRFQKVISYGNAGDINETELLEFLGRDPETRVVGAFIEGVKDLPKFRRVLAEVSRMKPVVILKGGVTDAGERAAAAHTGARASREKWEHVWRECKAVRVSSMEELMDVLLAFQSFRAPAGRGAGVIGIGGGDAIQAADDLESAGMEVPELSRETQAGIRAFTPLPGTSVNNPMDLNVMRRGPEFAKILQLTAKDPAIHLLIVVLRVDQTLGNPNGAKIFAEMLDTLEEFHGTCPKPVVVVCRALGSLEAFSAALKVQEKLDRLGVPVYPSITRAAYALGKTMQTFLAL